MKLDDFQIGSEFWCYDLKYLCTDKGTRTIAAIRIGPSFFVTYKMSGDVKPGRRLMLTEDQAREDGWFKGPPYAINEQIFTEDDIVVCGRTAEEARELVDEAIEDEEGHVETL